MKRDGMATSKELADAINNDYLQRNYYLNNLLYALPSINKHTVISLDGDWGSGKTFFIKELEYLITNNDTKQYINIDNGNIKRFVDDYSFFYFNAWENDHLPAMESILYSLIKNVLSKNDVISSHATSIAKKIINIPINILTNGSENLDSLKETYYSESIARAERISKTREEIDNLLIKYKEQTGKRILFVVDDLDRCKPSYAVELLETLKHYFNGNDSVFLICANNNQLQYTVKKYYGEDFDGLQYLDRFYDLLISLPQPDIDDYVKYCLGAQEEYWYNNIACDIAKEEGMSLRQVNRFFAHLELLDSFFDGSILNNDKNVGIYTKKYFSLLAIALRLTDREKFDRFICGDGEDIINYYANKYNWDNTGLSGDDRVVDSYKLLFSNDYHSINSKDVLKKVISLIGFSVSIDK